MKLTVVGTGYVGLVTGTCFAEMGCVVTCVDIDDTKVLKMSHGECPIFEPGLETLMKTNIEEKRLFFSTSFKSVESSRIIILAVGTPSSDVGQADLKYLYAALDAIIPHLKNDSVIVIKSTVPVGTGLKVKMYLSERTDVRFAVVNNPEFLKEGSAVQDFMSPDRVIIGASDEWAVKKMDELYDPFLRQSKRVIHMSNLSAEMTKYAANCFLATKISFINEVARLCDLTHADIEEVRTGMATDPRIGTQFLYPGPGYGGSCFPKDIKAFMWTGKECGLDLQIIRAAENVNKAQKNYMFEKILSHFNSDIKGRSFAVWGVSFKANTDDIRESSAIEMVRSLHQRGAIVKFYDPVAGQNFIEHMRSLDIDLGDFDNKYDVLNGSDALIVLTEWKQFRSPDFDEVKSRMKNKLIFDARNLFSPQKIKDEGFSYYGIGRR